MLRLIRWVHKAEPVLSNFVPSAKESPVVTALETFRSQYPQGCLVSDLVMVQDGQYVVRAAVMNDGQTIATGLAASLDVQIAEDQARERAIALLGIKPSQTEPLQSKPAQQKSHPATEPAPPSAPPPSAEQPPAEKKSTESVSAATEALQNESEEDLGPPIDAIEESAEPVDESLEPLPTKVSAAAIALENFNASAQPVDLSDVIAQTDVELTRLGWTSAQGREYLEKTYGKRSRQQLTDEELMSFLLYLEEQ